MLERKNSVAARGAHVWGVVARHAGVMVLLLGLAACGQKGPLMLAKPTPPAGAASSPAAMR